MVSPCPVAKRSARSESVSSICLLLAESSRPTPTVASPAALQSLSSSPSRPCGCAPLYQTNLIPIPDTSLSLLPRIRAATIETGCGFAMAAFRYTRQRAAGVSLPSVVTLRR